MPARGWSGALRYGLPGLLLGLALASGGRGGGRELWAQGTLPIPNPSTLPTPAAMPGPMPMAMPMPAGGGLDRSRAAASGGEADGTIAFTTSSGGPAQLLYLIDTRSKAFTIYRVDSAKGTVKLDAARQYGWDLKLSHYNNLGAQPTEVESMVKTLPTNR